MYIVDFLLLLFLCFILILGVLFYLGQFISLIRTRGVPCVSSFNEDIELMREHLKLEGGEKIIDLGCGNGKALRFFLGEYPINKGEGYELNFFEVLLGKILSYMKGFDKKVIIKYKDFKKVDLKDADYVYVYLLPKIVESIEERIFENIGEQTVVIVNAFDFPNKNPFQVIKKQNGKDKFFLYKKNNE